MDNKKQSENQSSPLQVDINQAPLKELIKLPGIGKTLAQRIIENRPYTSSDDLIKIDGINATMLQRIQASINSPGGGKPAMLPSGTPSRKNSEVITMSSRSSSPPIIELSARSGKNQLETKDGQFEDLQSDERISDDRQMIPYSKEEPLEEPSLFEKESSKKNRASDSGLKGKDYLKIILASSFISIFLSVFLMLLVLGLINRSLNYTTTTRFDELQQQVNLLDSRTEILSEDVDSLRTRIDSLETVSGRVSTLEKDNEVIRKDLEESSTKLQNIQSDVDELSETTRGMKNSIDVFDQFLGELQTLLSDLLTVH